MKHGSTRSAHHHRYRPFCIWLLLLLCVFVPAKGPALSPYLSLWARFGNRHGPEHGESCSCLIAGCCCCCERVQEIPAASDAADAAAAAAPATLPCRAGSRQCPGSSYCIQCAVSIPNCIRGEQWSLVLNRLPMLRRDSLGCTAASRPFFSPNQPLVGVRPRSILSGVVLNIGSLFAMLVCQPPPPSSLFLPASLQANLHLCPCSPVQEASYSR
ncbi:hypothetical protein B0O80DRAFT_424381 [Mortierella sp. GBAus27b]|nr:hypothetical protein B0O80DRAFT_424381 [Mortierella sp. GBAus27b]